jgi:hypothetical protein
MENSNDSIEKIFIQWILNNEQNGFESTNDLANSSKDLDCDFGRLFNDATTDMLIATISRTKTENDKIGNELFITKQSRSEIALFRAYNKTEIVQFMPIFVTPKFKTIKDQASFVEEPTEKKTIKKELLTTEDNNKIHVYNNDFVVMGSFALFDYLPLSVVTLLINLEIKLQYVIKKGINEQIIEKIKQKFTEIISDYIKMATDKNKLQTEREDLLAMPHLQVSRPSKDYSATFNHKLNTYNERPTKISDCSLTSVIYQRDSDDDNNIYTILSKCVVLLLENMIKEDNEIIKIDNIQYMKVAQQVEFTQMLLNLAQKVSKMNYFVLLHNKILRQNMEDKVKNEMHEEGNFFKRPRPESLEKAGKLTESAIRKIRENTSLENSKQIILVDVTDNIKGDFIDEMLCHYFNFKCKSKELNAKNHKSKWIAGLEKFDIDNQMTFEREIEIARSLGFNVKENIATFPNEIQEFEQPQSSSQHQDQEKKFLLCSSNLKLLISGRQRERYSLPTTCFHENISVVVRRITSDFNAEQNTTQNKRITDRKREFFKYLREDFTARQQARQNEAEPNMI